MFKGYLADAIKDKIKYVRYSGKALKRERKESDDTEPSTSAPKKKFKQFPHLNSEPPVPPGEDDASYSRNQKLLLSQERKSNPNKQTISILMDRTFAFRRRDILRTSVPVGDILQQYPSLKRLDQVNM